MIRLMFFLLAILAAVIVIGCNGVPTAETVNHLYDGLSGAQKLAVNAHVHPSTEAINAAIDAQARADEAKAKAKERSDQIAQELAYQAWQHHLAEAMQLGGLGLIALGCVWILLAKFFSMPVGWGAIPIAFGVVSLGSGLLYGEIVLFFVHWGQKIVATMAVGTASLIVLAVVALIKEYYDPPKGFKGLFFREFWHPAGGGTVSPAKSV